ncbi:MAG: GWxTD domain-containing protein [Candidatus Aminicenantes bacterium]|nr:GWxTD domain-containing protein [Candidatus Aminicenantes bacterium]
MKNKKLFFLVLSSGLFYLFLLSACRLYNLERKLAPEYADFLSKVRYIITSEERKIFLELPDSEKDTFIEEFWRRRDPDPETEENEFKIEYFNRLEKANELFLGEGRPGWLTDRGRIYILFGPPTDRITYPMGTPGSGGRGCQEIWYYGNFPVVFLDESCTGHYVLVTLSLEHLHELNLAQSRMQKTFPKEKEFLDFKFAMKKNLVTSDRIEGVFAIDIPYETIWFSSEGDQLKTVLDVTIELRNASGQLLWQHKESYPLQMTEEELKAKRKKDYHIEIPFVVSQGLETLRQEKGRIEVRLNNQTGGEKVQKLFDFKI